MYDLPEGTIVTVKRAVTDWSGHTLEPGTRAKIMGTFQPVYVPAWGSDVVYSVRYLDVAHDAFVRMAVDPCNVEVLEYPDNELWDQDFRK